MAHLNAVTSEALIANLLSFGSTGSRVPYMEKRVALVRELTGFNNPKRTRISRTLEDWLASEIDRTKREEALNEFKAGSVQGVGGFLGVDGEMVGERKIKLICTYILLLIAWPEIDEMIHARPPKRMEDLWNWLAEA